MAKRAKTAYRDILAAECAKRFTQCGSEGEAFDLLCDYLGMLCDHWQDIGGDSCMRKCSAIVVQAWITDQKAKTPKA